MPGLKHENQLRAQGHLLVAGIDEAGRGAWAGPVVAGAVILPSDPQALTKLRRHGVNDSKQLTETQRNACRDLILSLACATATGVASSLEIDVIGIVPATRLAMQRAIAAICPQPTALIIDAVHLANCPLPQHVFNFADSISLSVAAASILAKTTRDRIMFELNGALPDYGFARHKGYGTAIHATALRALGPCPDHRKTFAPVAKMYPFTPVKP